MTTIFVEDCDTGGHYSQLLPYQKKILLPKNLRNVRFAYIRIDGVAFLAFRKSLRKISTALEEFPEAIWILTPVFVTKPRIWYVKDRNNRSGIDRLAGV